MANRVLIVGWDGADWEILDPLLAAGELPNLAALIERGRKGVSRSCLPSHSWAAWPTFLTGCDPAGHGVFDILEYRPGVHEVVAHAGLRARHGRSGGSRRRLAERTAGS
jgi:predicted AlkP superfamily phosphohydrolase/phosphomutase